MTGVMAHESPSSLPSFAIYNILYLSLSQASEQKEQWRKKLDNVRHLAKHHTIVALLETHVDAAAAELFFCSHVQAM